MSMPSLYTLAANATKCRWYASSTCLMTDDVCFSNVATTAPNGVRSVGTLSVSSLSAVLLRRTCHLAAEAALFFPLALSPFDLSPSASPGSASSTATGSRSVPTGHSHLATHHFCRASFCVDVRPSESAVMSWSNAARRVVPSGRSKSSSFRPQTQSSERTQAAFWTSALHCPASVPWTRRQPQTTFPRCRAAVAQGGFCERAQ